MTTKYYAIFPECSCCGLSKDPKFLVMTSGVRGGYKLYHYVEDFKNKLQLIEYSMSKEFDYIEDEYDEKVSREDFRLLLHNAKYFQALDYLPC